MPLEVVVRMPPGTLGSPDQIRVRIPPGICTETEAAAYALAKVRGSTLVVVREEVPPCGQSS